MRVLLINSNLKGDILAAPPIGLCYVASAAQKAGHEVQVVDLCFQRRHEKKLKEAISQFAPEVIGLSVRNIDNVNMLYPVYYLPLVKSIVDYIRTVTSAPIVVGGP
ncbi:MAG: cobalamin-dependent protein, partial [Thermodesulfobacteriota bacterium]